MDFFGQVDKTITGKVKSQMPAWYFDTHIEELEESIASAKRRLNRGEVPHDNVPYVRAEIDQNEKKLADIQRSKPSISDGERDKLHKYYKELSKTIGDSLFTRSDMNLGLASAHEEANRMTKLNIPISKELQELAIATDVKVEKGKISRNSAAKMFKLIGKLLGEATNIEVLRKDKATVRTNYGRRSAAV